MARDPAQYAAELAATPREQWTPDALSRAIGDAWPATDPPPWVAVAGLDQYRERAIRALFVLEDNQPGDPEYEAAVDAWVYGRCTSTEWCADPPADITPLLAEGHAIQRAIDEAWDAERDAVEQLGEDLADAARDFGRELLALAILGGAVWLAVAAARRPS